MYGNVHTNNIFGIDGNLNITPSNDATIVIHSSGAIQLPSGIGAVRPTGVPGYIRYNTDNNTVEYYNGTAWIPVTNTVTDQLFDGDGVNDTYTLDQTATEESVLVSINGTIQQPGISYTIHDGNQITFAETPLVTDTIDVRFLGGVVSLTSTLSDDLTVSGNISLTGLLSAPQVTKLSNSPGTPGQMCWDSDYIYVCTAPNVWKRSTLNSY
jgi:hypothetical protein